MELAEDALLCTVQYLLYTHTVVPQYRVDTVCRSKHVVNVYFRLRPGPSSWFFLCKPSLAPERFKVLLRSMSEPGTVRRWMCKGAVGMYVLYSMYYDGMYCTHRRVCAVRIVRDGRVCALLSKGRRKPKTPKEKSKTETRHKKAFRSMDGGASGELDGVRFGMSS